MNPKQSVTRRLSLLAGSSFFAACMTATAISLAPMSAQAANECGNPSANGSAADTFTCATPPTYPTGVDYSATSDGDLTVILRNRFDTTTTGTGGIRMFGDAGEDMTLQREDNPLGAGDPRIVNTAGRAIDVTTQGAGDVMINLTDGDPTSAEPVNVNTGNAPIRITGSTDAIRAAAFGSGDVSVIFARTGAASGVSHPVAVITAGAAGGSGIVARSASGDIEIDTRGASFSVNATNGIAAIDAVSTSGDINIQAGALNSGVSARLYGVRAETGGAGAINLTVIGLANVTGGEAAQAAVDTTAGTGATAIVISGRAGGGNTGTGVAIRARSNSTSASSAVTVENSLGTVSGAVDFSGVTAGGVTFSNLGSGSFSAPGVWEALRASIFSNQGDTLIMDGGGNNTLGSDASISMAGGNDTFRIGSTGLFTAAAGTFDFGAGVDQLTVAGRLVANGTSFNFGSESDTMTVAGALASSAGTFDFGAGNDALNLSGAMAVNGSTTFSNLEMFNNTGVVYLGGTSGTATDDVGNDVLTMTSGTFAGSGRVVIDLSLNDSVQTDCSGAVADCLNLRGASTSGVTLLTLNNLTDPAAPGVANLTGVTVVDVGGAGTSAAGHFVLDPNSEGYITDRVLGGAIGRPGLFAYALRYDEATQRHIVLGLPRSESTEYAMLPGVAHMLWHMTSEAVTDHPADLRDGVEGGAMWLRVNGEYTQRDTSTAYFNGIDDVAVDNSYKIYAGTVVGGLDLIAGQAGEFEYVSGLQAGYVSSSFELNESDTAGTLTGYTAGVYGGLWNDRCFLNGTVNYNGLTLEHDSALGLKTNTFINSIGARADAGIRLGLTDSSYAEPSLTVAWVRSGFEELSLEGGEIQPTDAESLRSGAGLRLASTLAGESVSATYFVSGRAWYEFEGESEVALKNAATTLSFADEFTGAFGEAELGLNVFNSAQTLSGFTTTGVKWKDGYSAVSLTLGLRMAW